MHVLPNPVTYDKPKQWRVCSVWDLVLVWGYYVDGSQENSFKQWNERMEIAYHLVCWERHTV